MAEKVIPVRTYVIVCIILIVLTIATVAISFAPMKPSVWHIVVGLIIAACKASLVVLFFMHVLYSPKLTWTVILAAIFWMGILLVLTLGDYFTRGMLPFTPGH